MKKLTRTFYLQPTVNVARNLLGKIIVRKIDKQMLTGKIVETEAYVGESDPGCHASHGKTPRTKVMYMKGGHAYVYFIYGMYFCFNVVTEAEGFPAAVLIRAVEPLAGIEIMQHMRKTIALHNLTNGPGKFCQAFAINKTLNTVDLLGSVLYIVSPEDSLPFTIDSTSRIGLSNGDDKQWRFYIKNNPFVSKSKFVIIH